LLKGLPFLIDIPTINNLALFEYFYMKVSSYKIINHICHISKHRHSKKYDGAVFFFR